MNRMLCKPEPEEQPVGVVVDNPELFAAHKLLLESQGKFRQQWFKFAEELGFTKPRFCYSGFSDLWLSHCQARADNPDLPFYKHGWLSEPRKAAPVGRTKAELLVVQEKWKAACQTHFEADYCQYTCQEHTFHVMLGRPHVLSWPDCSAVYAEDGRLVFFGKSYGVTEYLEERGFEVVQVIDTIHQM